MNCRVELESLRLGLEHAVDQQAGHRFVDVDGQRRLQHRRTGALVGRGHLHLDRLVDRAEPVDAQWREDLGAVGHQPAGLRLHHDHPAAVVTDLEQEADVARLLIRRCCERVDPVARGFFQVGQPLLLRHQLDSDRVSRTLVAPGAAVEKRRDFFRRVGLERDSRRADCDGQRRDERRDDDGRSKASSREHIERITHAGNSVRPAGCRPRPGGGGC